MHMHALKNIHKFTLCMYAFTFTSRYKNIHTLTYTHTQSYTCKIHAYLHVNIDILYITLVLRMPISCSRHATRCRPCPNGPGRCAYVGTKCLQRHWNGQGGHAEGSGGSGGSGEALEDQGRKGKRHPVGTRGRGKAMGRHPGQQIGIDSEGEKRRGKGTAMGTGTGTRTRTRKGG